MRTTVDHRAACNKTWAAGLRTRSTSQLPSKMPRAISSSSPPTIHDNAWCNVCQGVKRSRKSIYQLSSLHLVLGNEHLASRSDQAGLQVRCKDLPTRQALKAAQGLDCGCFSKAVDAPPWSARTINGQSESSARRHVSSQAKAGPQRPAIKWPSIPISREPVSKCQLHSPAKCAQPPCSSQPGQKPEGQNHEQT